MADVTVIGLGPLGAAMAAKLVATGHETVVWNRTATRTAPLVEAGARAAATPAEAVAASPVVIVCVKDYEATDAILAGEAMAALDGRVLVQLSTGSPAQARAAAARVAACGGAFLAGHVQAYPREIGHADTSILLSGDEAAFRRCEAPMRTLAPALSWLSSDAGGALVMSLAITLAQLASRCGVMNGLAICEGAGLSRQEFARLAAPYLARGVAGSFRDAFALDDPAYREAQAAMTVWQSGLPNVTEIAEDAGCDATLIRCFQELIDRAVALGWGDVGIAALSQSFLSRPGPAGRARAV